MRLTKTEIVVSENLGSLIVNVLMDVANRKIIAFGAPIEIVCSKSSPKYYAFNGYLFNFHGIKNLWIGDDGDFIFKMHSIFFDDDEKFNLLFSSKSCEYLSDTDIPDKIKRICLDLKSIVADV